MKIESLWCRLVKSTLRRVLVSMGSYFGVSSSAGRYRTCTEPNSDHKVRNCEEELIDEA
jgi:hypothetical protein